MNDRFFIKTGDTSPSLKYQLLPTIDLTGATVVFNMRSGGSVIISRAPAVIVGSPVSGVVAYDWIAGNTATVGTYEAEFEVTYAGGAVETYPNSSYIYVMIIDGIA